MLASDTMLRVSPGDTQMVHVGGMESATMLETLLDALSRCMRYDNCMGRFKLFCMIVHLASSSIDCAGDIVSELVFVSGDTQIFETQFGIVVYSVNGSCISMNVVVPRCNDDEFALVRTFVSAHAAKHTIHMAALYLQLHSAENMPVSSAVPSRFVDSPDDVSNLRVENGLVILDGRTCPVHCVVRNIHDLPALAIPAARSISVESADPLCWHRIDGDIVCFRNTLTWLPTVVVGVSRQHSLHNNTSLSVILDHWPRCCEAQTSDEWVRTMCDMSIPFVMREYAVALCVRTYGITDEMLKLAVRMTSDMASFRVSDPLLKKLRHLGRYILKKPGYDFLVAATRFQLIGGLKIRNWYLTSQSVWSTVCSLSDRVFKAFVKCAIARHAMNDVLLHLKHWCADACAKAKLMQTCGCASPLLEDRITIAPPPVEAVVSAFPDEVSRCDARRPRKTSVRRTKHGTSLQTTNSSVTKDQAVIASPPPSLSPRCRTHHERVQTLSANIGLRCDLIGSGTIFEAYDIDVAITVPWEGMTLDGAYRHVASKTGWKLVGTATGRSVVILTGTLDTFKLDVQVWRGSDLSDTVAETRTKRAIEFAKILQTHMSPQLCKIVRDMHAWTECTQLKGHRICKLPGIAVTVLAIFFFNEHCTSFRHVLVQLYELLCSDNACDITFSTVTWSTSSAQTCRTRDASGGRPLRVYLDDVILTTRMTACTTRYLAIITKYALDASSDSVLRSQYYDARVAADTIICAYIRPPSEAICVRDMATVLRRIDGHPLIESVAVEEDVRTGVLTIRSHIRYTNQAHKFGFQGLSTCVLESVKKNVATLSTGNRRWPLAVQISGPIVTSQCTVNVPITPDLLVEQQVVSNASHVSIPVVDQKADSGRILHVPNAPWITCDVICHFKSLGWEICDGNAQ